MSQDPDLPVKAVDLLVLVVVSVVGGTLIAGWAMEPRLTPNFAVAISSGTVMLAFFLFIPVMGVRMFLEDDSDDEERA